MQGSPLLSFDRGNVAFVLQHFSHPYTPRCTGLRKFSAENGRLQSQLPVIVIIAVCKLTCEWAYQEWHFWICGSHWPCSIRSRDTAHAQCRLGLMQMVFCQFLLFLHLYTAQRDAEIDCKHFGQALETFWLEGAKLAIVEKLQATQRVRNRTHFTRH